MRDARFVRDASAPGNLQRAGGHAPSSEPGTRIRDVREQIPSISLATVYKNIKTFVDDGLLRQVSVHHGSARLETSLYPHHHLVCIHCREIVDLDEEAVTPVRMKKRAQRSRK